MASEGCGFGPSGAIRIRASYVVVRIIVRSSSRILGMVLKGLGKDFGLHGYCLKFVIPRACTGPFVSLTQF